MKSARWLSGIDRTYLIRVIMALMISATIAIQGAVCSEPPVFHVPLLIIGVVYPHLLQIMLGRIGDKSRDGRFSHFADGFFSGGVMPAMGFSTVPCVVLLVINVFGGMALGGGAAMGLGLLAALGGVLVAGLFFGFSPTVGTCSAADYASYTVLLVYAVLVASLVFRYTTTLRERCETLERELDSAELGGRRTERALMAVLPASAAREYLASGLVLPKVIEEATLLLAEFSGLCDATSDIDRLNTVFVACEEIVTRHGMEAGRPSGRRFLAIAGKEVGPEGALAAALELRAFVRNHIAGSDEPVQHFDVRAWIHCGTVVAGMVQAEKFGYDVVGTGVDELLALARLDTEQAVLISDAARSRLRRDWRLALISGGSDQPVFAPVEHGGL